MPLYDFECPHGHRFERQCSVGDREEPVPCEGLVNRVLGDDELDEFKAATKEAKSNPTIVPAKVEFVSLNPDHDERDAIGLVAVKKVPCILSATILVGTHSNPGAILDHGLASNRDAAREGRYDPLSPSRRFMAKGRGWRK